MASGYRYAGGLTDADFSDGNSGAGWQPQNFAYGAKIPIDAVGTITSLGVFGDGDGSGTKAIKIALYDSGGNLLANDTATVPSSGIAWVDSGAVSAAVGVGDVYVMLSAPDANARYGYDSAANGLGETVAYASFPPSTISVTEDETGTRFGVRVWLEEPAAGSTTFNAEGSSTLAATIGNIGTPVIEAADATVTTIGTAADPWSINNPAAVAGDGLIFIIAWDDSTAVTSVAAPTGPNGETISSIVGPQASASTEMRMQAWATVATGTWTSGTVSFNPSASETCRAVVLKVPAGEFDATTFIGASSSSASAGTAETNITSPAFSAGSTDGGGRLVLCFGSDTDAITAPASGTSTVNNATGGAVGLCVVTRDTPVTNSESIASITATITGDSWAALGFVVRKPVQTGITNTVAALSGTGTLAASTSFYQISETTAALAGAGILNATLETASNVVETVATLAGSSDLQATTSFYQIVDTVATVNGTAVLNAATSFWQQVDTVASLSGSGTLSAVLQDDASNIRNTVVTIAGSSALDASLYSVANTVFSAQGTGTLDAVTTAPTPAVEAPARRLGGSKRARKYESVDEWMRRYMQEEPPVQVPPTRKIRAPAMYHRLEEAGFTKFELSKPEWVSFWQIIPAPKQETVTQAYNTIERKRRQIEQDDEEWLMLM